MAEEKIDWTQIDSFIVCVYDYKRDKKGQLIDIQIICRDTATDLDVLHQLIGDMERQRGGLQMVKETIRRLDLMGKYDDELYSRQEFFERRIKAIHQKINTITQKSSEGSHTA